MRNTPVTDVKGGPGSGNFGHVGRPGQVGGSGPGGSAPSPTRRRAAEQRDVPPEAKRAFDSFQRHGMPDALIQTVIDHYRLGLDSIHGPSHWQRVLENGLTLARQTGARQDVVTAFALLHDSQRQDEGYGWGHGENAAEFARRNRKLIPLDDEGMTMLLHAMERHSHGDLRADPTVETCWDADRLDLPRPGVGIRIDTHYLSTEAAKDPATIRWATAHAHGRAKFQEEAAKGGPGSGNWGHAGRPGLVGGSAPGNHPMGKPNPVSQDVFIGVPATAFAPGTDPTQLYTVRQPTGAPIRGTPISPDDPRIPDDVYHMTTNLAAVHASGEISARGAGGLGGDKHDQIVSTTIDKGVAFQLADDTRFMAQLVRDLQPSAPRFNLGRDYKDPASPHFFNPDGSPTTREQFNAWSQKVIDRFTAKAKSEGWEFKAWDAGQGEPDWYAFGYGIGDWQTHFFNQRDQATSTVWNPDYKGKQYRNPIFYDVESFVNYDPENIGVVEIPKANLATGALITDFDLEASKRGHGLSEIRIYGDLPLQGAHFFKKRRAAGRKGGPGSGNWGHAGRPGLVGGSAPGRGSGAPSPTRSRHDRMLEVAGGDEALAKALEAELYNMGSWGHTHVARPWEVLNIADDSLTPGDWEVERGYRVLWDADTGAEVHLPIDSFAGAKAALHEEQAERQQWLDEHVLSKVPDDLGGILGDFDVNRDPYSRLPEEQAARMEFYGRAADYAQRVFEDPDLTLTGRNEIYQMHDRMKALVLQKLEANPDLTPEKRNEWAEQWTWPIDSALEQEHEFKAKRAVASGQITPLDGYAIDGTSISAPQGREWTDLPPELYHAATNSGAVLRDQLRSRRELGQRMGVGLGGGEDDTISFTGSKDVAKNIERALHEAHLVASGKISVRRMVELASAGAGAEREWFPELVDRVDSSWLEQHPEARRPGYDPFKDGMPAKLRYMIDEDEGRQPVSEWQRNLYGPQRDIVGDHRWEFYHTWSNARQYVPGGFEDPLFFGTDWQALGKLDPREFATLEIKPKPKARGYEMSALGEWRTVGGDNVTIKRAVHNYNPDSKTYIDAVTGRKRRRKTKAPAKPARKLGDYLP